jgi:hypothetical protein
MRLHRRLVLVGRDVVRIDLHRRIGEGGVEIADGAIGRLGGAELAGIDRCRGRLMQIVFALRWRIVNAHQSRGTRRLLERIGDDEGDGETEERHDVVVQRGHRARKAVRQIDRAEGMLRRRVVLGQHQAHAGRMLCLLHVHRGDAASADRRRNDNAVERRALRRVFVGIGRLAGDLQAAIDAIERKADRVG